MPSITGEFAAAYENFEKDINIALVEATDQLFAGQAETKARICLMIVSIMPQLYKTFCSSNTCGGLPPIIKTPQIINLHFCCSSNIRLNVEQRIAKGPILHGLGLLHFILNDFNCGGLSAIRLNVGCWAFYFASFNLRSA